MYYPPRNSTYNQNSNIDIFESVSNEMSKYNLDGDVLLCGDFNEGTGCGLANFISNDNDKHVRVADNYLQDSNIKYRISQDSVIDARGRELIDLCIESQLRILNGRSFGDSQGMYTSYNNNGNSVVYYMLVSENLLSQVLYFNVGLNIPQLSDHSKICCKIFANFFPNPYLDKLKPLSLVYKWSSIAADNFKDALCSNTVKCKINDLEHLKGDFSVDQLFTKLTDIIITAADMSLRKKQGKNRKGRKSKKWFDGDLYKMRKLLDQKGHLYATHPNDPYIRGSFYKLRKMYVKSCKQKRKNI